MGCAQSKNRKVAAKNGMTTAPDYNTLQLLELYEDHFPCDVLFRLFPCITGHPTTK